MQIEELTDFVATAKDHLREWLEKSLSPCPDIIAVGFQELMPQTSPFLLSIPSQQSLFSLPAASVSTLDPALEKDSEIKTKFNGTC